MKKAEALWLDKVAQEGCIVCSNMGFQDSPAAIHHIRRGMGMGQRNDNYHVLPLCQPHHQGPHGIGFHSGPKRWQSKYGTEMQLYHQLLESIGEPA